MRPGFRVVLALLIAAPFFAAGAATAAQDNASTSNGTPDEQAACAHDATRFCREDLSDTFRVLACLQQNRQRLRKVCRQVLEAHGQ